jgi:DNA ligase (NAD+)
MNKVSNNEKNRANFLREEIARHDKLYYVDIKPEISDQEYDKLFRELRDLEEAFPELRTTSSPTHRVGNSLNGFVSVDHAVKMGSLDNTYDKGELDVFDARVKKVVGPVTYSVELKIDGAAISLWYEKGILTKALTRGDGQKGDDVTENVRTIRCIPLKLLGNNHPDFIEIRGEVYMLKSVWKNQNVQRTKDGKEPFANPRNAAAGSLKLLDPKDVASRHLSFFCHMLGKLDWSDEFRLHSNFILQAREWGLPVVRSKICKDIDEAWELIEGVNTRRSKLDYETDGMVVKVDNLGFQEQIGHTSRAPKFAMAYKYPAERAETTLLGIDIQVGKTGALTPVARLKPVYLAGSTISNASLHNQNQIDRLDVRVGDQVLVEKAAEIIPQVVDVLTDKRNGTEKKFRMPDNCPSCGTKSVKKDGEAVARCPNHECKSKVQSFIEYYVSRDCMDLDGIGGSMIEKLIDAKLIKDPADLYCLTKDQLLTIDGIKEKSAEKALASIESSKDRTLARLVASLAIPLTGRRLSDVLAEEIGSLKDLSEADVQRLEKIEKVGQEKARAIVDWFREPRNKVYIQKLADAGLCTKVKKAKKTVNNNFVEKSFVLTGTLERMTRNDASAMIKERGGKTSGSVSRKTDFVLAGENAGSKLENAKELGVTVIDEKEFENMLKGDE